MVWHEWEQLKAEAAERHSPAMQIDSTPKGDDGGGGGPWGGLRSSKAAWTKAGDGVGGLKEGIGRALAKLEDGQAGLGGLDGCQSAAAQREVHRSWERYVKGVSKRCGSLGDLLAKMGSDQQKTDDAVRVEIEKLKDLYADTPDLGGQSKGR
ncbi:hypothetical protein SMD44_03248 [Streptomyces alboflavus]|uniref:Uncharacterized protein n=1 Tax=Streptomyces alboflavus TaxID=67267 RepID=A0A1Z1WBP9_9ACTN|nr:hypothetical protein [Streptomyces alboflavus]ARX83819.1 hypothetical protein SMD44_03248 [Streptomyces alboflavus]